MKSAFIFLFFAIVFVAAIEDVPEDPKIVDRVDESSRGGCPKCSTKEAPICGFNGKCARWFTNPCYIKAYNCYNNERFVQCDNSVCQKCCRID